MPYSTVSELPAAVRNKLKGKKLRQWRDVFNSSFARHEDESRAFAEAWAAVKKLELPSLTKREKISKQTARYKGQTVDDEHCSVCSMFIPPSGCTLVKGSIAPGAWCQFFERKKGTAAKLGKADEMSEFNLFLPLMKVDEERRLVSGYASTPRKDSDGEIITLKAIKKALPGYLEYGNIREMHKLNAVGVAAETNVDEKGLYLTAYIADDEAWKKCVANKLPDGTILPPVYKGFSIGGRKVAKSGDTITEIEMTEISIVDRPANPDCRIDIAKSEKMASAEVAGYLVKAEKKTPEQKAIAKLARVVETLAKSGPPAAKDGFSLPAKVNGELSPNDSRPNENATRKSDTDMLCEKHQKPNCALCAVEKAQEATKPKGEYGDVEYADPGYQDDKKPRYPVNTEDHIRAAWNYIHKKKNAAKYSSEQVAHIKAKIVSAWKAKIDKGGPPAVAGKKTQKFAKMEVARALDLRNEGFLTLRKVRELVPAGDANLSLKKGMNSVGSLAYCFDSIRDVQRRLLMEGKREGGDGKDKALANDLGQIAKQLALVMGQKATREGEEALTLSGADDQYVNQLLTDEVSKMDTNNAASTGDPIADALAVLMKRAAEPTRKARMAMADDNVKKARKAMKEARKAVEDAHGMHKAAYIAKAAKKGEKDGEVGDFDHAGAMEKLQKAYQEIDKARTFNKAAAAQLEKLARSGQRGQEAGDSEAGFFEVPAGVKDLSPDAMAGAAPGTSRSGGVPPAYPGDGGVYAGKAAGGAVGGSDGTDLRKFAKNGMISAEVAELLLKQAGMAGELEALRRMPAAARDGRQRPFAFDLTKTAGGASARPQDLQKALFEGVDVGAINGTDERAHVAESAKVIGNLLTSGHFGKSVLDPSFRGSAGSH